ncbi:MAG TPA: hypothetical protein VIX18_06345 [Nitrospirota bacterium]
MRFTRKQQKVTLIALLAALIVLNGWSFMTREKPKTAPLTYKPGATASAPVRRGIAARAGAADPLSVFLEQRAEKYPGLVRDIFRMENPQPAKTKRAVSTAATPTQPLAPVKTPEELAAEAAAAAKLAAAEAARADLSRFRFLGYLTDRESKLFLSKDGELFIVKSGDAVLKTYRVKEASKDHVVLRDTVTGVEVRIELSGGEPAAPQPMPMPGF